MIYHMNKREFLIKHLTEGKSYQEISDEHQIPREQLSNWWNEGEEIRNEIKRSNQLYNSRVGKPEFSKFKELGKREFYQWFADQPKVCRYCGIEEFKLQKLFDKETGPLNTKRGRGRTLELERRDSASNEYSPENCILACYVCNNHKSDLISEEEHLRYFAPAIKKYLDDKFSNLNDLG